MSLDRVRVIMDGFSGARGYMNLYFAAATASNLTAVGTLLTACKSNTPTTVTYTVPSSGDTIDEHDGHLLGGWTATAPAPITGSAAGVYSAPTGFVLEWRIAGVVDGHRPIGKSFFVPASSVAFDNTGKVTPTQQSALSTAAQTFVTSATGFSLWHRPVFDRTVKPPTLTRPGGAFLVVSGACASKAVVLRSRRD